MRRFAAVTIFAVLLFAPLLADAERNDRAVMVMTRNMYFGADLTPAIEATSVPQLIAAVTGIFATVEASDVPARVDAIAAEIAATTPDLVGLQEVAGLLPGDGCCRLIRFVEREVILARTGRHQNDPLTLSNDQSGTFSPPVQARFTLPTGDVYFEKRGWVAVDVTARGAQFRFISTHLLPEGLPVANFLQGLQGDEVLDGPANTTLPVIYVCDCNSRADGTGTTT